MAHLAGEVVVVHVRMKRFVPDLLGMSNPFRVEGLGSDSSARFEIRPVSQEERQPQDPLHVCSLVLERSARRNVLAGLRALAADRPPEGFDWNGLSDDLRERAQVGAEPRFDFPLSRLPNSLRDFFVQTYADAGRLIPFALAKISWRANLAVPPYTLRAGRMEWKFANDETWRFAPIDAFAYFGRPDVLFADLYPVLTSVLKNSTESEPLGHELWREAWNLRGLSPRSALLVGYASMETGLKELIASLVPAAAWLVGEVPAPPVCKMLKEYLPLLPRRDRAGPRWTPKTGQ